MYFSPKAKKTRRLVISIFSQEKSKILFSSLEKVSTCVLLNRSQKLMDHVVLVFSKTHFLRDQSLNRGKCFEWFLVREIGLSLFSNRKLTIALFFFFFICMAQAEPCILPFEHLISSYLNVAEKSSVEFI